MIRFQCPTCQKVLKAPQHGAGRKVSCPRCGQRLLVPPPARTRPRVQNRTVLGQSLPDPAATASVPPPGVVPPAPAPAGEHYEVNCPGCGAVLRLREDDLLATVECGGCGSRFLPSRPDDGHEGFAYPTGGYGGPGSYQAVQGRASRPDSIKARTHALAGSPSAVLKKRLPAR